MALFFLLGMNLRVGIGGIPPLLLPISRDLRLSGAGQGMLTSAAIVSMAACAPAGPRLVRRFGIDSSISLVLVVLAAGEGMRIVAFTASTLFASIIAVGAAAGAGSTIVPALIIERVPDRRGLVTGFLAAGMALGVGFTVIAWLSPFFVGLGLSTAASASRLFLSQAMQLASMTTLPPLADRLRDLRALLGLPLVCIGGSLAMLLADPLGSDPYAVAVLGIGVGGSTALGIALTSRVSDGPAVASSVGGIVYTVAFACSSLGPVALGELHDRTGSYAAGFAALAALTIAALVASSWLKPGVTVKACD